MLRNGRKERRQKSLLYPRIKNLKCKIQIHPKPVLDRPEVKDYLSFLHRHFILAPADKPSNNVTFTCKYDYFKTLSEELVLGLCFSNSYNNPNYEFIDRPVKDIIQDSLQL